MTTFQQSGKVLLGMMQNRVDNTAPVFGNPYSTLARPSIELNSQAHSSHREHITTFTNKRKEAMLIEKRANSTSRGVSGPTLGIIQGWVLDKHLCAHTCVCIMYVGRQVGTSRQVSRYLCKCVSLSKYAGMYYVYEIV